MTDVRDCASVLLPMAGAKQLLGRVRARATRAMIAIALGASAIVVLAAALSTARPPQRAPRLCVTCG